MSDMRDLLEKMNWPFAGHEKGQEDGDQVRGHEKFDMISPVLGEKPKKHPAHGRLVGGGGGSAEEYEESVEELAENYRKELAEWGAAGTAVGPGNDDQDPVLLAQQVSQGVAQKDQIKDQIAGLVAQVQGARSQLSSLNRAFPQGANPVEKAMSLQQTNAEKNGLKQQIAGLRAQIAQLRSQAM